MPKKLEWPCCVNAKTIARTIMITEVMINNIYKFCQIWSVWDDQLIWLLMSFSHMHPIVSKSSVNKVHKYIKPLSGFLFGMLHAFCSYEESWRYFGSYNRLEQSLPYTDQTRFVPTHWHAQNKKFGWSKRGSKPEQFSVLRRSSCVAQVHYAFKPVLILLPLQAILNQWPT